MPQPINNAVAEVLDLNLDAAEQVKSVSNELEVVHAVLTSAPSSPTADEVPAAIARTEELAQQLADTAVALDKANELLGEIAERGEDGGDGGRTPAK